MTDEIKIYYRYCDLDKEHQYSVVFNQSEIGHQNYWIWWVWYKMGAAFGPKPKFYIYPYKVDWGENSSKLIKSYKSCNTGTDRVAPAILKHFQKVKNK